MSNIHNILQF
uniref:Uncharacterized protein n=1 Tax=Arundo donax TaxID=35708 RepID=A0A0A9FX89_ARUDO